MSGLDDTLARIAAIDRAQAKIARALRDLEQALQCEVQHVELRDVEVTEMQDTAPRYVRCVVLELRKRPAYDWATYPNLQID